MAPDRVMSGAFEVKNNSLGFRVFQNSKKYADRERRAYQVEIDFAKEHGYNDIVE